MKTDRRKRIFAFNRQRSEEREKSADMDSLLHALPPGQVKQLLKDETCAAILKKYGITSA